MQCYKSRDVAKGINLMRTDLRYLMFADARVVVTESGSDLQKVLQVLEEYCARWDLSINVEKSKIVIFGCMQTLIGMVHGIFALGMSSQVS